MARVVFMGTPAFALPPLRALVEDGHDIVAVVTQPDRPAGRGGRMQPSAVKAWAQQQGLAVWQPERLRGAVVEQLRTLQPEVIVVAAYGEILRPEVLSIPPRGCLNIHASLLPRWRGASPVAAAILAGDDKTGATLMQMDAGMDTGPILAQESLPLQGHERCGELSARLAEMGAALLRRVLPEYLAGKVAPQPQDDSQATYCAVLRKEDGRVDWTRPAAYIERMVRAYDPWPGAYTFLRGRRLRLWRATVLPETPSQPPGTILVRDRQLLVTTGEGLLALEEVQLEGRRRVSADEFLRGQTGLAGTILSTPTDMAQGSDTGRQPCTTTQGGPGSAY